MTRDIGLVLVAVLIVLFTIYLYGDHHIVISTGTVLLALLVVIALLLVTRK
jgi:hypothetical protein